VEDRAPDLSFEDWRIRAEESKGHSPSAEEPPEQAPQEPDHHPVSDEGPADAPAPQPPLPSEKISLKMRNTDVTVVLRALARAVNQNIIINENVRGAININIDKSP